MRILIHGLNFAPELVGVGKYTGEMAGWLAARGHQVRAVTAPPFNPQWKVMTGFSGWRYASEDPDCRRADLLPSDCAIAIGHLRVLRCPLWVPQHPSAVKRILHLASFALASFPVMLGQGVWRPEVVLVVEPTLFSLPAAWLCARFSGARSWLHVQDFEADAGFELGLLNSSAIRQVIATAEKIFMSAFGRVSTISQKMLATLLLKGVSASACCMFPNWVDTAAIYPRSQPSPLRAELGISATETVALYAGTMGRKQGLEILAETACRLSGTSGLRFVFCGEGPGKAGLETLTAGLANVQWLPLQPFDRLNDLLNLADIHLLPQKADAADLVMPSKLTGMLASGRPVVATAAAGTELAQTVEGRGIVVEPGDAGAFAHAVEELAHDRSSRERLGKRAREYAISELEKETILYRFEQDLLQFVAAG
ncbi:MAG: glycosyltransferase WbuB [Candidatus Sulfotelmatobacter sp.]